MVEIQWDVILACVVVVVAGIGLIHGDLTAQDFIYVVGLVFSFLAGKKIGFKYALKKLRGENR